MLLCAVSNIAFDFCGNLNKSIFFFNERENTYSSGKDDITYPSVS